MVRYRCAKGCTRTTASGNQKPQWHNSKRECPYEKEYAGPSASSSPSGTTTGGTPPPTTTVSAGISPSTRKPGFFTFGSKPAETTTRAAPSTTTVQPEWEVDSDHSLSLFELFDTILIRAIRFGDHALSSDEYKVKEFNGHVLINSSADEELVKKKMGRKMATTFTKALGATSAEEAHGIIESGGVLVLVGGGLMAVGSHILVEWRPAIKVKIELRAKRRKEKAKPPEGMPALGGEVKP